MADPEVGLYVGVNLEIQGKEVMLAPKTPINQISKKGLELELPNNLYLGKAGEILDGIASEFGYSDGKISEQTVGITIVDNLIKKVMDAELTISDLYLKVYPDPPENVKSTEKLEEGKFLDSKGNPIKKNQEKFLDFKGKEITQKNEIYVDGEGKPIKVSPKPTEYTVGLAATWSEKPTDEKPTHKDNTEKLGSKFKLKGLYLMITNEDLNVIEARRLKQKSLAASTSTAPAETSDLKKEKQPQPKPDKPVE